MGPDLNELLARARGDLRLGVPVVLRGATGAVLVAAAETLSSDRLREMQQMGALDMAVTDRRAETLKARPYDGDLARIVVPRDADRRWIEGVADPSEDLARPMKGPLVTRREGNAVLHRVGIALCKAARLLPAALLVPVPADYAASELLTELDAVAAGPLMSGLHALGHVVSARVPLRAAENARLHIFRPGDGTEEHYAIEIGRPDRSKPVLARLHSACFTGDVIGSLKCDCGPQLDAALAQMGDQGEGVLLYLQQEGRGIGLANKMRAYALQDQGFDTVEANHRLGFEDDERDFRLGAQMLGNLGFKSVRLLTNNPAKIAMMSACGIEVTERVPLKVGLSEHNERYLAVKAAKSGHLL
ncbi:GTP cyclohydrolase II [Sagittula sp. SSi028]|uniref:GTP cyclohydrolase II n=1 Tax=Sagittula sp. SSi028 TaxID=3400636 RepID=UPI003AF8DB1D